MRVRTDKDRQRLGELLVVGGALSRAGLEKALDHQRELGARLGTNLLELGLISEKVLLEALRQLRQVRTVSHEELLAVPPEVVRMIPPKLARRYQVVPFAHSGGSLLIAGMDPGDAVVEEELKSLTSCLIRTVIGLELRIQGALERYYRFPRATRLTALARRLERTADAATREMRAPEADAATRELRAPEEHAATCEMRAPEEDAATRELRAPAENAATREMRAPEVDAATREDPFPSSVATQEVSATDVARLFDQIVPGSAMGLDPSSEASAAVAPAAISAEPAAETVVSAPAEDEVETVAAIPSPSRRRRRRAPPKFIELDAEDRALLYSRSIADEEQSPEERLDACAEALQKAEIRDEIADHLLDYCAPYFARRLLLIRRKESIIGWRGEGRGLSLIAVRGIEIPQDQSSVFERLGHGIGVWRGPLPPFPAHQSLLVALGSPPHESIVLPISIGDRVIGYFYGDNGDGEVTHVPVEMLQRLIRKAAVAFEVVILKNKIRLI